ncbi:MAG: hypothetical protein J6K81_04870 [Rikenellaceae bacterium]|nr:hypothetical protein [Rikenellaceae bacterium]
MKRPKNIRRNVMRGYYYVRNMMRIKHYHGYGVHSPFVYGLVRHSVMMSSSIVGDDCSVFDALSEIGVSRKRAIQLQNMFTWAGYKSACYLTDENSTIDTLDDRAVCYVTTGYPMEKIASLCALAEDKEVAVCVMKPYDSRVRSKACRELIKVHKHTSVDNRGFLLLFFNPHQPKQHFKL